MNIIGYASAILIGLSLGLVGGGGSILTVPILVYFFSIEPTLATTYSLSVVGISSSVGSIAHFKQKNVDIAMAFQFGLPSLVAVFLMRWLVMPLIPHQLYDFGTWQLTKPTLLMLMFSILMIAAASSMISRNKLQLQRSYQKCNCLKLAVQGVAVGAVTGFVGVGGGFLIIPSLVVLAKIPMKKAVGTSLMIMAISSLLGVSADLKQHVNIDYAFMALFSVFTVAGILAGSFFTKYIDESKLKPIFGWFVLLIGVFILGSEFLNIN